MARSAPNVVGQGVSGFTINLTNERPVYYPGQQVEGWFTSIDIPMVFYFYPRLYSHMVLNYSSFVGRESDIFDNLILSI